MPLDLLINRYFRANKSLGSKDRAFIAETLYALMRWKGLLDAFNGEEIAADTHPTTVWEARLNTYLNRPIEELRKTAGLAPHTSVSFPEWLFDKFVKHYGPEQAAEIALVSNTQAPASIRANLLKTTRDELLEKLALRFPVAASQVAPNAILFKKRMNYFELPEFTAGLFEVQDEGSQLLAELVKAKPGDQVMDYCSGSGGKALAFAPRLQGKGQIYLHDVRKGSLQESKKRLKRAGVQNVQIIPADDTRLKKLKKKCNWVLVDAPCSGTGTLRRNPDMKWRLSEEGLDYLTGLQRTIFEKAQSYLAPDGHIVYGTCSILSEENEAQVEHFLKTYPLELCGKPLKILPTADGPDGFFGAVFRRK